MAIFFISFPSVSKWTVDAYDGVYKANYRLPFLVNPKETIRAKKSDPIIDGGRY